MNIAYIPARGGSKSIPKKNIKNIADRPLVYWVIEAACNCAEVDAVFVSTDSDEIRDIVAGFSFSKLKVVGRSEESATDTASTETALIEFVQTHDFTNIALIQATSPLLTSEELAKGFVLKSQKNVDSVISVVRQKRFVWQDNANCISAYPINYDFKNRPRRQDFDGFLVENGAFYITSREALLRNKCRISGNIKTVEMPIESYFEIDEPEDWIIVETLMRRREKNSKTLIEGGL